VASTFRYADDARDLWDRQLGEPAEEYDWFVHYRNEAARRSHTRVAERFKVKLTRIARVAKQNRWSERYGAYKAANSAELNERYHDLLEAVMVPFAQGMVKLAARTVTAPVDNLPADRAMTALATGLRLAKEPGFAQLIQVGQGGAAGSRELDALDVVLDTLADRFPEAHDLVLDALDAATRGEELPTAEPDDDPADDDTDPAPPAVDQTS
jgi:hypothetical protein